jgi:hypothetical protein
MQKVRNRIQGKRKRELPETPLWPPKEEWAKLLKKFGNS